MAAPITRWHEMASAECAREVSSIVEWLHQEQSPTRIRALQSISLYEGRRIHTLDPEAYSKATEFEGEDYRRLYMNAARGIVHSVVAKVAGRTRPKSQMVASDADWQTKRKAKKLERFVEAQMAQGQGRYRDSWALCLRAFQDACTAIGRGTLKVFADIDAGRIAVERVLPWEVYTDPRETRSGCRPMNRFQRTFYDKDLLAAKFPEHRDLIWAAKDADSMGSGIGKSAVSSVQVYEGWRLPFSKEKPGRHVICIEGCLLESTEWTRDEFPFIDVYWSEEFLGDGGTSLIEEVEPVNDELNYHAERMREKMRLASNLVGSYEEGSLDETFLRSNENGIWIPRRPGSPPPAWTQPGAFSPEDLQWFTLHWEKCFEISGASAAAASSQKPAGVTSGIALRTVAAMETERFSVQASAYELMAAVDLPRHIIACARELYEHDHKFAARWAGSSWLQEIPWREVDMEDDMYVIQAYPVNGIANTPADRLQLGQDLFNAQIIGKDSFLRIVQMKDIESELNRTNVQQTLIERYIEQWLDANPEDAQTGKFRYYPPIPFMDHASAIVQCAESYMQAQLDGAPEWNLEFFLRFMGQCDAEIKKVEQYRASLQQAGAPAAPQQMTDMTAGQAMVS
jgi:hypothetical protein